MDKHVLFPFRKQVILTYVNLSVWYILQNHFVKAKINCRLGELFWLLSLQKNEDGLSMSVVDFITVQQEKVADFVPTPTSLFAFTLPISV